MKRIANALAGIGAGCLVASGSHAASIQSLTIEEIGLVSGGLGTSALQNLGGEASTYDAYGALFGGGSYGFVSAGSTDGAVVMGTVQGNNAFTLGFSSFGGALNTLRGAPSGSISGGVMTLDMSGFGAEDRGFGASVSPDAGTLITAVSMIDSTHYYYTADWSHRALSGEVFNIATGAVVSDFDGWLFVAHLEGVATLAPVPEPETYAMMLAGLGLVGVAVRRRRALV